MHRSSMPGPFPFPADPCSDGSPSPCLLELPRQCYCPKLGPLHLEEVWLASLFTFIALFLIQHSPHFSQNERKLEIRKGVVLSFVTVLWPIGIYHVTIFSANHSTAESPRRSFTFLRTSVLRLLNPALCLALTCLITTRISLHLCNQILPRSRQSIFLIFLNSFGFKWPCPTRG